MSLRIVSVYMNLFENHYAKGFIGFEKQTFFFFFIFPRSVFDYTKNSSLSLLGMFCLCNSSNISELVYK